MGATGAVGGAPLILGWLSVPRVGQFLLALRSSMRLLRWDLGIKCALLPAQHCSLRFFLQPLAGSSSNGKRPQVVLVQSVYMGLVEVFFIQDELEMLPAL